MLTVSDLVSLADRFLAHSTGLSGTTLSHRMLGDTRKLDALRGGADITTRRFNDGLRYLSDHWPNGVQWPAGVPRPAATGDAGQEDAA